MLNSLRCNTPIAPLACYIQGLSGQTVFQNQTQIQFAIFHLHPFCWITQNFPPHYFHPEKLNFHFLTLSLDESAHVFVCAYVCHCLPVRRMYLCVSSVFVWPISVFLLYPFHNRLSLAWDGTRKRFIPHTYTHLTYIYVYICSNNFSDQIIYSLQFCFMRDEPQSSGGKRLLTVKQANKV